MTTSIILSIIIIVIIMLAMAGLSELTYQFFGKGKKLELCIHSDDGFEKTLNIEGGDTLLNTLQTKNYNIPSGCGGNATCGQCKIKLYTNMGPYSPTETPLFDRKSREETRKFLEKGIGDGYTRLSCQVRIDKDMDIFLPKSTLQVKKYSARVIKKIQLTSDKLEMRLRPLQKFNFKPGQYIQIGLPEDYVEQHYKKYGKQIKCFCKETGKDYIPFTPGLDLYRAYSIATIRRDIVTLITRTAPINPRVPIESGGVPCLGPNCTQEYLQDKSIWNLWAGEKIRFTGPYGNFCLKEEPHKAVFVAGGAGLAPILALLDQWFAEGRKEEIYFFLGERRFQDIPMLYISKWLHWQKIHHNFKFIPVMSGAFRGDNPSELNDIDKEYLKNTSDELRKNIIEQGYIDKSGEKWLGKVGFIGPLLTDYFKHDPKLTFYLCGPAPMTVTVIDAAANTIGLKKENVLFDDFTGTLTPSLDLIYLKLMITKMFKQLGLHHADTDIEKMTTILIIKLILRDKIDESYIFLDKIKEILAQQSEKESQLNKLFKEYE
ncbi:MAG: 2Fe-2S iron-sulfur cluster binding domain-containing protein [Candidatus Scalindua rubra]|uniref:Na+-translocating NADH-quinone reductase subunit F n=1 Tax=Candidatus Scalindua brodae TaxID=237368 RepID=A0A0B0EN87_9BACT|nr:MAG: Na+-translocating NADH-quinone reductase subunit F [Candidatus Scalindua brodae]MBZ0107366.1 2Fe-2S iron-sulfur cluster binding domain-containing protein [Candidatus Scalindua rubra]TWU31437.1 Na(+)-translocating NADH-quinone reductase subunit F [Candidatus Brocadiaceae bacterium S225]